MLKKLFKYETKSLSRLLCPILAAALGFGLLDMVLAFLQKASSKNEAGAGAAIVSTLSMMAYSLGIFALVLVSIVILFFIVQRFYKSFFGDEGYLTFVLPVDMKTHLLAKIFSGMMWISIYAVVLIISLFVAVIVPFSVGEDFNIFSTIVSYIKYFLNDVFMFSSWQKFLLVVEILVVAIMSAASQIIIYYTAVTLGGLIMRKHKVVGAVVFYFLISMSIGLISQTSSSISIMAINNTTSVFTSVQSVFIPLLITYAAVIFGGFYGMNFMLTKKLNIE